MTDYPSIVKKLITTFGRLPNIGPKAAERIVFFLLQQKPEAVKSFTADIETLRKQIKTCETCQSISTQSPCTICSDKKRDHRTICVVAEPQDIYVIEKTGEYSGLYHVLGGVINPVHNITPDSLNIESLLKRIKESRPAVKEVILATNPDIEGESTALHLARKLKSLNVSVSRLAKGLPMGSTIEYADEVTISNALIGRRQI